MKFDDLRESPAYQLWIASNAWQRVVRRALEPFGLTHAQFVVLAATQRLTDGDRIATQADICRFGALDENMTSSLVKVLSQKGLLERFEHPEDRRAYALRLTEVGVKVTEKARNAVKPATQNFFAPVGDEASRLAALLRTINDHAECSSK